MSTIPANQKKLHLLADALLMPMLFQMTNEEIGRQLRLITMDLSRRPRATDAPPVSRTCTPAMRAQIRAYHAARPTLTQQQIAETFGVTAGRVSEAIAGKRR
jgi:hypothetical protein